MTTLNADMDTVYELESEVQALRAELAVVVAERNTLRAAVDTYAADLVRVTAERDALRGELADWRRLYSVEMLGSQHA